MTNIFQKGIESLQNGIKAAAFATTVTFSTLAIDATFNAQDAVAQTMNMREEAQKTLDNFATELINRLYAEGKYDIIREIHEQTKNGQYFVFNNGSTRVSTPLSVGAKTYVYGSPDLNAKWTKTLENVNRLLTNEDPKQGISMGEGYKQAIETNAEYTKIAATNNGGVMTNEQAKIKQQQETIDAQKKTIAAQKKMIEDLGGKVEDNTEPTTPEEGTKIIELLAKNHKELVELQKKRDLATDIIALVGRNNERRVKLGLPEEDVPLITDLTNENNTTETLGSRKLEELGKANGLIAQINAQNNQENNSTRSMYFSLGNRVDLGQTPTFRNITLGGGYKKERGKGPIRTGFSIDGLLGTIKYSDQYREGELLFIEGDVGGLVSATVGDATLSVGAKAGVGVNTGNQVSFSELPSGPFNHIYGKGSVNFGVDAPIGKNVKLGVEFSGVAQTAPNQATVSEYSKFLNTPYKAINLDIKLKIIKVLGKKVKKTPKDKNPGDN